MSSQTIKPGASPPSAPNSLQQSSEQQDIEAVHRTTIQVTETTPHSHFRFLSINMQSARIIFDTSVIILLLFSFPRSYGFRDNICSRDSQPNCQEQPTNIYHQFERHLNYNAVRNNVDVRRERLLQIRAVDNNERDLSVRSVNRERTYSRISPQSIIVRQNRDRNLPIRDLRVFEQFDSTAEFRDSRNREQVRERSTPERKTRVTDRNSKTNISNIELDSRDRLQMRSFLERKSLLSDRRTSAERTRKSRESKSRSDKQRLSEMDVRNSRISKRVIETNDRVRDSRERLQTRERLSMFPERNSRSVERRISEKDVKNSRLPERVLEDIDRVRDRLQTREKLSLFPKKKSRSDERRVSERDVRNSKISERVLENTDHIRDSRERLQTRERPLLSPERESRSTERRGSERDVRDSKTFERVRKNTDRVKGGLLTRDRLSSRMSERDVRNSRISEQVHENTDNVREFRDRFQTREMLSPVSKLRSVERRMSEGDIRDSRISEQVRVGNSRNGLKIFSERISLDRTINIRDSRLQGLEKKSPNRKISEHNTRLSEKIHENNHNTDRVRDTQEHRATTIRINPERRVRLSERRYFRLVGYSSLERAARDTERRSVLRDSRLSKRSVDNIIRKRELRFTQRRSLNNIRTSESRKRQTPERDAPLSQRRNNREVQSRSLENIRTNEQTRDREIQNSRFADQPNIRNSRISESRQVSPKIDLCISERRTDRSNLIRRQVRSHSTDNTIRLNERSQESKEQGIGSNERNSIAQKSRTINRSLKLSQRIQERELIFERRNNDKNTNNRESRLEKFENMRLAERTREIRKRLQERERLTPGRQVRVSEHRSTERERNANNRESQFRTLDNMRSAETRDSRERLQERERLTPDRQVRLSERRSTERDSNSRDIRLTKQSAENNNRENRERLLSKRETRISERRNRETQLPTIRSASRDYQQIKDRLSRDKNSRLFRSIDGRLNTRKSTDFERQYRDQTTQVRNSEQKEEIRDNRLSERPIRETRFLEKSTKRPVSNEKLPSALTQDRKITERRILSRQIRDNRTQETKDSRHRLQRQKLKITDRQLEIRKRNNRIVVRRNGIRDSRISIRSVTIPEESRRISINGDSKNLKRLIDRSITTNERHIITKGRHIRDNTLSERQEIRLNIKINRENVNRDLKLYVKNMDDRLLTRVILNRSTDKRQNERLSRLSRNSERLIDNNRRINIMRDRVLDQERLENKQRISDRRQNERQINILLHEQEDGFNFAPDQRDMSVFRTAYPTNKVQDFSVEFVENIWINVVKILLASFLFMQISRSKTADLKMFKCVRVPMFSQLFKEKVQ